MSTENNHMRILYSRYCHLLKALTSLECATEVLFKEGILTRAERAAVLESHDQKEYLCQALTSKGVSRLVEITKILTIQASELKRISCESFEHKRQKDGDMNDSDVVSTSSSTVTTSTTSSTNTTSTEGSCPGGEVYFQQGMTNAGANVPPPLNDTAGSQGQVHKGSTHTKDAYGDTRSHQRLASTGAGAGSNDKHLTTDVPDPPVEMFSMATSSHVTPAPPHKMEDAFIILFFTFVTQQLQVLWPRNKATPPSHPQRQNHTSGPDHAPTINTTFPWLQVDMPPDEARDYFPSDVVKGVVPNSSDPATLKVSMLLEAFQQFLRAFEDLKRENLSLQRKGKMYEDVVRKYRALEAKMNQMQAGLGRSAVAGKGRSAEERVIADLQEQLKQVEPLQMAYVRSEERCQQLVEVTQQWAIECDEKLQLIQALEKETDSLKTQIQQLGARVDKYKKFWMDNKDLPRGRVSDFQFEELRSELASRRELYDQVLAQRDEADKKIKVLVAELENLRDHNVQLQDRADNFKVQAQVKEPSVREMSLLLEKKGVLEHEVERLKRDNAELSDKIVALEILIQDLTAKITDMEGDLPKKKAQADDWLVISPTSTPTPTPQHQYSPNPPPAYTRAPHSSQLLAPPTNPAHHHHNRPSHTPLSSTSSRDDDILSLASSEGGGESGNFSSHESTSSGSSRPSNFSRSNSGPPSPFRSHDMPLRARDVPALAHDVPLRARAPSEPQPRQQEPQGWLSHDPKMTTPTSVGGEDYTSRIRYPNNSRILVQPLRGEDISLKSEGVGILRARDPPIVQGEKKDPVFCDRSRFDFYQRQQELRGQNGTTNPPPPNQPTAYLPQGSALLASSAPNIERRCPICQHTFLTLSEREFEAHAAVCYK